MLRTQKVPFVQSRSAMPLLVMTTLIIAIGIYLPMGGYANYFKLQALPASYFVFLTAVFVGYLVLTQAVKNFYTRRYGWQ